MLCQVLLLALCAVCVSARFTVPVPIHYEIEAQLQKQTGVKTMRWDPTNLLTYLAAVYSQCSNLYSSDGARLIQRGRVPNATAYSTLLQYFDASLLPSNMLVSFWDIESDVRQDAGTVDRDIRKLAGVRTGAGPITNLPNVDTTIRSYDRFGCSVETACRMGNTPMMSLVCIFGQSVPTRPVAGGDTQPPRPTAAATTRPTARTVPTARPTARPTTTRRPTTTTTVASPTQSLGGGLYKTYEDHSTELYDTIVAEAGAVAVVNPDVVTDEDKVAALDLCNYENNQDGFNADLLRGSFPDDVQPILYGVEISPIPSAEDLTTLPITDVAKSALRTAMGTKLSNADAAQASSVACAWAMCSQKFMLGCAAWGMSTDYNEPAGRRKSS